MPKANLSLLLFSLILFFFSSCRSSELKKYDPQSKAAEIVWTEEELVKEIAAKEIYRTSEFSGHGIRLRGKEKPHIHERHDLVVFMVKGQARVYVRDRWVKLKRGRSLKIAKGTLHWAENLDAQASEAYVVFIPPLDSPDTVMVSRPLEELR